MWGPFLAVSTALTSSLMALVSKKYLDQATNTGMVWLIYTSTFIFALTVALLQPPYVIGVGVWKPLSVSLASNVVALYMYANALKATQLSVLVPIMAMSPVIGMLTGYLINHEVPAGLSILGLFVISGSAWLLLAKTKGAWSVSGTLQALGAMTLWALTAPFDKVALQHVSSLWYTVLLNGGIVIVFLPAAFGLPRSLLKFAPLLGLIGIFGALTQFEATRYLPVAVVIGLKRLSAVFSVIWGYVFLKEPQPGFKLVMTLIMLVGSILVLLGT